VSTEQIAVRLPAAVVIEIDTWVRSGRYQSRASVVRAGIDLVAHRERQRAIDEAIVEGYRRIPATTVEISAAEASMREAVAEEPW
jgi:Arc/MetJ-type ribon-helix-helix transcriptional regulator